MQGEEARYKIFPKPAFLCRFRRFIVHSDWDEVILAQEEWIDRLCIGIIIVASLYFIPPIFVNLFDLF
jgi:hypothetical protein